MIQLLAGALLAAGSLAIGYGIGEVVWQFIKPKKHNHYTIAISYELTNNCNCTTYVKGFYKDIVGTDEEDAKQYLKTALHTKAINNNEHFAYSSIDVISCERKEIKK